MIEINRDYINEDIERIINDNSHKMQYPHSAEYEYKFMLVNADLDKKCKECLQSNNGFIIKKRQNIKKDLKDPDSIFSNKFGNSIDDENAFANRYRCECGHLQGKINHGIYCEYCHTPVKFVDDNFSYLGWMIINEPYTLIHPNLYNMLASYMGAKELDSIIKFNGKLDENGKPIEPETASKNPYAGIGILGFKTMFKEVMDYFLKPNKKHYYDFLMKEKDKIFTHSIPVYTHQLRPFSVQGTKFTFEANNAYYNTMASEVYRLNKDKIYTRGRKKPVSDTLYSIQNTWLKVTKDIDAMMSGKRGYIRSLSGGRFNFSSRVIIIPDPSLNIDEIKLPYCTMIEFMEFEIVSILSKTMPASSAYMTWQLARSHYDPVMFKLMQNILDSCYYGCSLNRNPSIRSQSMRFMRVVGINKHYAATIPLQILADMNADFDGDCLNVIKLDSEAVRAGIKVFNPRYSDMISRNNGLFNSSVSHESDTFICINSFVFLGRDAQSKSSIEKIKEFKSRKPVYKVNIPVKQTSKNPFTKLANKRVNPFTKVANKRVNPFVKIGKRVNPFTKLN